MREEKLDRERAAKLRAAKEDSKLAALELQPTSLESDRKKNVSNINDDIYNNNNNSTNSNDNNNDNNSNNSNIINDDSANNAQIADRPSPIIQNAK